MKYLKRGTILLVWALFVIVQPGVAQTLPQDLSNINVDQLSDSQVKQIMLEAQGSGFNDSQMVQYAQRRGLSQTQVQKLITRVNALRRTTSSDSSRQDKVTPRTVNNTDIATMETSADKRESKIFGANLFRNSGGTFEPNLRLATPVNYILGPDDQLEINIYGNSVANWKLTISPEGNINMPSGGVVNLAGKTIEQATNIIKTRLRQKNFAIGSGTSVNVTLGNIRSIKVIMAGEVIRPGTYTLPSLGTAFNALTISGGPNDNGSFRKIEIIRNNRVFRHLDIYDFLVKGSQKDNISLQDQDIIRVPTYSVRVEVKGEVKIPGLFEVLPGETLSDIVQFTGGFTSKAYRANIQVSQISDQQRRITDVTESNFGNYIPLAGDIYTVNGIIDRYENRVTIKGAVFRPGEYELQKGFTLSQLITKAAGLREDAFSGRGVITRLNSDNSTLIIPFEVRDVMSKNVDIPLQREDIVTISSIFELRDQYTVKIAGEVRSPGEFAYADSMKVEDLIVKAGGFREGASKLRVEVARRIYDNANGLAAKILTVDIDPGMHPDHTEITLKPFDIVSVYRLPGYEEQGTVMVKGEVLYPGLYVIQNRTEKISDIIKRAGGLVSTADPDGSTLKRSYIAALGVNKNQSDTIGYQLRLQQRNNKLKRSFNDSTQLSTDTRNNFIGINLKKIIESPGSATDLTVKDGDEITIPQQQQVVQVNGEVHVPSGVVYLDGKGFKSYVINAGGFSSDASKKDAYIIYPNGTVEGTSHFLFFNSYPKVKPGSEIIIPKKPITRGLNITEILAIISTLGTTAVLTILTLKH